MKRIGIITTWNVPNYGAFLQAYALQKVISAIKPDYEVLQIPHISRKHYNLYYSLVNTNHKYFFFNPKFYIKNFLRLIDFKNIKRVRNFLNYYKRFIPHCNSDSIEEVNKFDKIILGSDIIWDYTVFFNKNDRYLFGNNLNVPIISSYATSFGSIDIEKNRPPNYVIDSLKTMKDISVRDEKSYNNVNKLVDRDAKIVLDPTFLFDWNEITNDMTNSECLNNHKYAVVYGSYYSKDIISDFIKYCKSNNMKIICLDSYRDNFEWCDQTIELGHITPFEWLNYVKNSEIVLTSTFHGLVLSIILNKKLIFSQTKFIKNKSEWLIKQLELEEPIFNNNSFKEKLEYKWDFQKINNKLQLLKEDSLNYLKQALSDN